MEEQKVILPKYLKQIYPEENLISFEVDLVRFATFLEQKEEFLSNQINSRNERIKELESEIEKLKDVDLDD